MTKGRFAEEFKQEAVRQVWSTREKHVPAVRE